MWCGESAGGCGRVEHVREQGNDRLEPDDFFRHVREWNGAQRSFADRWRQKSSSDGGVELHSWAFASTRVSWARLTEIRSRSEFIAFSWTVIPSFEFDVPLFQAELIEVKRKLFLLVMDARVPRADNEDLQVRLEAELSKLHDPLLPSVEHRPSWSRSCIGPTAVWTRPMNEPALPVGVRAFRDFLRWSAPWIEGGVRDPGRSNLRREDYLAVRAGFLENEPARPYMHRAFGVEWSEAYMERFLYPPLDGAGQLCPPDPQI